MKKLKTGVIDVGGGMRGIYGAGVFDRCLDDGISFDYCCGVSAGCANAASFLAKQKKRNYEFFHDYAFRKEYMSLGNLLKNGSYIDLNYIYSELSDSEGENPLDYSAIMENAAEFCIVATKAEKNTPVYFTKKDLAQNDYAVFKASCCIPVVCKPVSINGFDYFDGGLSDPLPIEKLIREGCERIVVILTRPIDHQPIQNKKLEALAKRLLPKYPEVAEAINGRHDTYARQLREAIELENRGKVLIVAPDDCCGVDTLKKSPETLEALYQKGYEDGGKIKDFIEKK